MKAKPLPFQAGDPATGDFFFDRKRILEELKICMISLKAGTHQDFALVSPRRFGKSSVLKTLRHELLHEGLAAVLVDCSDVYPFTLDAILEMYVREVLLAFREAAGWRILPSRIIDAVKGIPSAIGDVVSERVSRAGAEIGKFLKIWVELKEKKTDVSELFETAIELPERLAEKTGVPCTMMLDEFQVLNEFDGKLLWAMRAKIQRHERVGYIISGSSVGMITKLFADKKSPFFNLFMVRTLGPFTDDDGRELLERRIELAGLKFSESALEKILLKSGNIPFNLQWLGLNCYLQARHMGVKIIDEEIVEHAYAYGLKNIPQFERDLARLTERQQKILSRMAVYGLTAPSKIAAASQVRDVNVAKELNTLIDMGYIKKVERGEYKIVDRVFEDWLKARFGQRM